MARKRYSKKEAINRMLRSLSGVTIPSEEPGSLSGEVLSEDEAFSDIAELFENSLPNVTGTIPPGLAVPSANLPAPIPAANLPASSTTQSGIIETATIAEAQAGTDNERAVTSAGVASALGALIGSVVEYGGLYNNSTGTAVVALSTSWAKITGSFQGDMFESTNINADYANGRVIVNHVGVLFVGIQVSFSGSNSAVIEGAIYLDGVRQESIRFRRKLGLSGDVGSASALGIIQVTGTNMALEFYAKADSGTPNFKLESGQMWCYGTP